MLQVKSAGGFFGRFLLLFVVLSIPWPGLGEAYGAFFRATGNLLFCSFGDDGVVRIEALDGSDNGRDMRMFLENTRTRASASTDGRTRLMGYEPTVFVASLILATPVPWSRRWKALCWGMAGVSAYAMVRLGVQLIVSFSGDSSVAIFSPGPTVDRLLGLADWLFVRSFAGSYVLPLGIWFLATIRTSDWQTLIDEHDGAPPRRSA